MGRTKWDKASKGDIIYLDRQNVECKGGAMSWFRLLRQGEDKIAYKASCVESKALKLKSFENKHTDFNTYDGKHSVNYLDRHHVKCDEGTVLQQFRVARNSSKDKIRYDYKCVKAEILCCSNDDSKKEEMGDKSTFYLDRQSIGVENSNDKVLQSFRLISHYSPNRLQYKFRMCKLRDEKAYQLSVKKKKDIVKKAHDLNKSQAVLNKIETEIRSIQKTLELVNQKYQDQKIRFNVETVKLNTLQNNLKEIKESPGLTC